MVPVIEIMKKIAGETAGAIKYLRISLSVENRFQSNIYIFRTVYM